MSGASEDRIERDFALIEEAAIKGERCPSSRRYGPITSGATEALVAEGRIRVEVYGKNWRVITILAGPHKGKTTAMPPFRHGQPYLVNGKRNNVPLMPRLSEARAQPWKPGTKL